MSSFIIYARKSTESEDRQVLSIDAQVKELADHAAKNNLIITKTFIESKSAKKPGRPVFKVMFKELRLKKTTGILCWKLDRLSRNMLDAALISELLETGVISEIRTPSQIYRNTSNDKFMTGLDWIMAKKYIDDLSENVKRGLRTKAQLGWLPGRAPLGYLNPPYLQKGQRMIIKDPRRFPLMRRMWDMLLSNQCSVPEILQIANEKWGFRRPVGPHTPARPLSMSSLYFMFTNHFYAGYFRFANEVYRGRHEPMVTVEEFERAQAILNRNRNQRPKRHLFEFTGLFRCGACGAAVTAEEKYKLIRSTGISKRYVYYHCTHRKMRSCREGSIEEQELLRQIDGILSTLSIPAPYLEWLFKYYDRVEESERKKADAVSANPRYELQQVETRLANLLTLKIAPENTEGRLLSDTEYLAQKERLLAEKMKMEASLNSRIDQEKDVAELTKATFNIAAYARLWFKYGNRERRRTILSAIGSNREIINKNVRISLHKPLLSASRVIANHVSKNGKFEPVKFGLEYTQAALFRDGLCARLRELDDVRTEIRKILRNPNDHPEEITFLASLRHLQDNITINSV